MSEFVVLNSIGNGNCAYHSIALDLLYESQYGNFRNIRQRCFSQLDENIRHFIQLLGLDEHRLSDENIESNSVDFIGFQHESAALLRNGVCAEILKRDQSIVWPVVQSHFNQLLEQTLVRIDEHLEAKQTLDTFITWDEYLDTPAVKQAILTIYRENSGSSRTSQNIRKNKVREWFYGDSQDSGLNVIVNGAGGLATDRVYAGTFELQLLSKLLNTPICYYTQQGLARNNFWVIEQGRILGCTGAASRLRRPANGLYLEQVGQHWMASLPKNERTEKMLIKFNEPTALLNDMYEAGWTGSVVGLVYTVGVSALLYSFAPLSGMMLAGALIFNTMLGIAAKLAVDNAQLQSAAEDADVSKSDVSTEEATQATTPELNEQQMLRFSQPEQAANHEPKASQKKLKV